jgi:glycerophosphoryl diester phosphodiesterase
MSHLDRFTTPARPEGPIVIAHRGLSWTYPENTLISYRAAADAGADLIELDFYATTDGVLACVHDSVLDRYLGPAGSPELRKRPIASLTWAQLSSADVGAWKNSRFAGTRVPRLSDVLERFAGAGPSGPTLLLEQKSGSPEQTLALLRQFDAVQKVIVQSFDWTYLTRLHELEPELLLAALGGKPPTSDTLGQIAATGARILHWSDSIRQQDVTAAHAAGVPVWVYTLNSELAYRGAQAMGIDGIATDRCDFARQSLRPSASPPSKPIR